MEGNTTNKFKGIKSENKEDFFKSELPEDKQCNFKPEKVKLEINECKTNLSIKTDTEEGNLKNNSKTLKRKVTEDGVMIERVLSEGEASSDFETVSSFDSKADFDDLDLSSLSDGDDFNVVVKIENELAFQNLKDPTGRFCYKKGRSNSPAAHKNRTDRFLYEYEYKNRRSSRREPKYRDGNNSEKHYSCDKTDKKLREREEFNRSRRSDCAYRSRRSTGRRSNRESRSRRSRSCERISRSRKSRSIERNRRRSSSYEDRKTEIRRSGSFDRNSAKSYTKRNSPSRKRRQSPSYKSPSSSVWKRLDKRLSPSPGKKSKINNRSTPKRSSFSNSVRKKERTPFLVELERKLKEAERLKNFKEKPIDDTLVQTSGNVNATDPIPGEPPTINQNSNPLQPTGFIPSATNIQGVFYPFQYVSMPTLSVDNLPLVPGPTGLPVHITMTGEQIPYDMDGRRIPIGPNGYYLPVDPTGRLFPHVISPANQAIPIHMTEDGILRLPNSDPVPYGPGYQLPVNIDGSVILISSDSKPLYPCPNLPKEPPLHLLQMMDSFNVGWITPQQAIQGISQSVQTDFQLENLEITAQQAPSTNEVYFQQSGANFRLLDCTQNPSNEFNKAELVKKYKEKARARNKDALKRIEIQKNLGVNSSKRGVKRSIPIKLLQRKSLKDDNCSSGSDMVLDSGDSDSTSGLKFVIEPIKDLAEEILSSDDEQGILKSACGINDSKVQNTESQQDDPIIRKIHLAIKSLNEKNYKPPVLGRFIISNITFDPVIKKPYESPLLRNHLKLPFITPDLKDIRPTTPVSEKDVVTFNFLPQKMSEKGELPSSFKCNKIHNRNFNNPKFPVFTFDFAMQCDFTSAIIKKLSSKVSELEMELVRLRDINANLFDHYRNAQFLNEKKNDELVKAMREIQERDNEIRSLKGSVEEQQ